MNSETQMLSGWGRIRQEECLVFRPETSRALRDSASSIRSTAIARGCGRSYGDAAQNGGGSVVDMTALDRMLQFDEVSGRLTCESGTTLAELIDVFLPRGLFPPVVPGTKFVSVGGAVASDIHGKNHHRDGSFSEFVDEITLVLPSGERVTASRTASPGLFWATIGGMGLTGFIETVTFRLRRVPSAWMLASITRSHDLEHALEELSQADQRMPYTVAWIDTLQRGARAGRSVIISGDHAPAGLAPDFRGRNAVRLRVPFAAPNWLLNRRSIGLFNSIYWRKNRPATDRVCSLDEFFFPLDSVEHWNRLYGPRGFIQFQCVLPADRSVDGLRSVLETLQKSQVPSFLAVLKRFGPEGGGLLSFPRQGWTLAVDLPMSCHVPQLARSLEKLVLDRGGRVYLAKDSMSNPEGVATMYPRLLEFREAQSRFDPAERLQSSLSRRLRLLDR